MPTCLECGKDFASRQTLYTHHKRLHSDSMEKKDLAKSIVDKIDENLLLSARNIKGVEVIEVSDINPVSLVGAEKVLFTLTAIKKAEELFS